MNRKIFEYCERGLDPSFWARATGLGASDTITLQASVDGGPFVFRVANAMRGLISRSAGSLSERDRAVTRTRQGTFYTDIAIRQHAAATALIDVARPWAHGRHAG